MAVISFKFGMPRQQKLWAKNIVYYGRPSIGVVPVAPMVQSLTDTIDNMHAPVNCVLIGAQQENKKAMGLDGALPGPMRAVFNEK